MNSIFPLSAAFLAILSVCSCLLLGSDLVSLSFTDKQILSFNLVWTFFILCLISCILTVPRKRQRDAS